jgi:hypothetical protein
MHPATEALLQAWRCPRTAARAPEAHWSVILGAARRARCAGHLAVRLARAGVFAQLPAPVRGQFESVAVLLAQRRHMLRTEIAALGRALEPLAGQVLLLKGAAYERAGLAVAGGRMAGDVDLLVPARLLGEAERLLRGRGWVAQPLDPYDERYYRDWSHELPPMRDPARGFEVDLHHALTPAIAGEAVDTARVLAQARADGGFLLPDPADLVVHCALHAFKDTELDGRLRDLMDFDLLVREFGAAEPVAFATALLQRADTLGTPAGRALRWAARYAFAWLGTPIGEGALPLAPAARRRARRAWSPPAARAWAMDALVGAAMLPGATQAPTVPQRLARLALLARYHLGRMPLRLLLPHLVRKLRGRRRERPR